MFLRRKYKNDKRKHEMELMQIKSVPGEGKKII